MRTLGFLFILVSFLATTVGCTQQVDGSFRYAQQTESYASSEGVNTKIDILWVVDNSSSMDVNQKKLRQGFTSFANRFLKPTWDIRLAVIPTDLFLANPIYWQDQGAQTAYLNRTFGTGVTSSYIQGLISGGKFTNPLPGKVSNPGGVFTNGLSYNNLVPSWGADYAKLLPASGGNPAVHDGPIAAYCQEYLSYFMSGGAHCSTRDDTTRANGTGNTLCLNPASGNPDDSQKECVNTLQNNSVHSGKVVIYTKPQSGDTNDANWIPSLINNFKINASTGTTGSGSERPLGSILQLINDNEGASSSTAFFRANALRIIVIVTDEEDQTQNLPTTATVPANYSPFTNYKCDPNVLKQDNYPKWKNKYLDQYRTNYVAAHPGATQAQIDAYLATVDATAQTNAVADVDTLVSGNGGLCCNGGSCRYQVAQYVDSNGNTQTGCPKRTKDPSGNINTDPTYSVYLCPDPMDSSLLTSVSSIKTQLDTFFKNLDGSTNPNYLIATITVTNATTLDTLFTARNSDDDATDAITGTTNLRLRASDRCERCTQLADLVGNGSMKLDIGSSDYSAILEQIGAAILAKKGTFNLRYPATSLSDLIVWKVSSNGTTTQVPYDKLSLSGSTIRITDEAYVLSLSEGDSIQISYQPSSLQ